MNAPDFGDLDVGDNFQKHSYPLGVMLNAEGNRFVDEGADFRNYTYAKYGREILSQTGQFAWQIFDAKVSEMLRDEYRIRRTTKVTADSLETLVERLDGVDTDRALSTLRAFNAAVDVDTAFDPAVKDARGTSGIDPPKSNWANRLDTPPFEAYGVSCGITFTFGGLHVDTPVAGHWRRWRADSGIVRCGRTDGGSLLLQLSRGLRSDFGGRVRSHCRQECGGKRLNSGAPAPRSTRAGDEIDLGLESRRMADHAPQPSPLHHPARYGTRCA